MILIADHYRPLESPSSEGRLQPPRSNYFLPISDEPLERSCICVSSLDPFYIQLFRHMVVLLDLTSKQERRQGATDYSLHGPHSWQHIQFRLQWPQFCTRPYVSPNCPKSMLSMDGRFLWAISITKTR